MAGDFFAQWKHWCTTGLVWYLAIRLYGEAIVLAVRRAGSDESCLHVIRGGFASLARWLGADWSIVMSICILASTHGCHACYGVGLYNTCDADIGYRVLCMGAGIWALRCLRVTGYSFAPTAEWM